MKNADFIVFDFETGGLNENQNPAVQIALLTLDGKTLKEKRRWETFIKPYDDLVITKKALESNGLKITDINSGISKEELLKELKTYFTLDNPSNAAMKRPIMVGHNVAFDMKFLRYIFKDDKKGLSNYIQDIQIDTYSESLRAFPNETVHKLGHICSLVGINLVDAHKAMNDVIATADLFKHFTNKLRSKKGGNSTNDDKTQIQSKNRLNFQF